MDVKAILLIGGANDGQEVVGTTPIAMLDVLGEPIVQRVLTRLERLGITAAAVVSEYSLDTVSGLRGILRPDVKWTHAPGTELWRAAAHQFVDFAHNGAELVLILRVGAYAEVDYEDFIQFHLDRRARVTPAVDREGKSLDFFIASASRRNDVNVLMRSELRKLRVPSEPYQFHGYVNRLADANDLRNLALDAFATLNTIRPAGREIKPGVWAMEDARIHPLARVLAPAFIGRAAKIRASAVVTRGSVIEHHAEVDCGTVVENATLLPHTYVGAGLDVTKAVVGFNTISSLARNVTVEITDPRLVSTGTQSAAARAVGAAFDLVTFLPRTLVSGILKRGSECATPQSIPEALTTASPALTALPDGEVPQAAPPAFPTNLFPARRYGNE